jgi:hypothetical protein
MRNVDKKSKKKRVNGSVKYWILLKAPYLVKIRAQENKKE